MKIKITLMIDNAAFESKPSEETARILFELAYQIRQSGRIVEKSFST